MEPGALFSGPGREPALRRYHELLGAEWLPERNPCPQPVSLERKNVSALLSGSYVVADKSDGVRYTLFIAQVEGKAHSLLIDRKLATYHVPVAAARGVYEGSVFDGELVWTTGPDGSRAQTFLVFDVAAFRGSSAIASRDLLARLEVLRGAFDLGDRTVTSPDDAARLARAGKIVCGGNRHGLSFRAKPCFRLADLDVLLRLMPSLPYPVDGLVFTPIDRPVGRGTDDALFKLKLKHTVDLELCLATGALLVGLGGGASTAAQRMPFEALGLPVALAPEFPAALQTLRDAEPDSGVFIVECTLRDPTAPRLSSPRRRRDKSHPNTARTVTATFTNLRENLQPEELVQRAAPRDV